MSRSARIEKISRMEIHLSPSVDVEQKLRENIARFIEHNVSWTELARGN
jgi:hypothetical protein